VLGKEVTGWKLPLDTAVLPLLLCFHLDIIGRFTGASSKLPKSRLQLSDSFSCDWRTDRNDKYHQKCKELILQYHNF